MHIVLVNLYDAIPGEKYAQGRYSHLSRNLSKSGHKTTWFSANFHHGSKTFRSKSLERISPSGLSVKLLPVIPYKRNLGIKRLYSDFILSKILVRQLLILHKKTKIDLIVVSLGPIITPFRVTHLSRKIGVRSIADVQDLYPAAFQSLLPSYLRAIGELFFYPMKLITRLTLRYANGISSLSRSRLDQALSLQGQGHIKPSRPIYLNVKGEPARESIISQLDGRKVTNGKLKVLFIGTVGSFYDFKTIFEALLIIRKESNKIELHIIGDGPYLERTKELSISFGLSDVHYYGFIPFEESMSIIQTCNLGIVPIAKGWPSCIPNKPIDYMGIGMPILSSIPGEMEEMIDKHDLGYHYVAGDSTSLASVLNLAEQDLRLGRFEVIGRNCLKIARSRFTIEKTMDQFDGLIREVMI